MIEQVLDGGAAALYAAAAIAAARAMRPDRAPSRAPPEALAAVGAAAQGVALVLRWRSTGHGPYFLKDEIFASLALVAVAALLLLRRRTPSLAALAVVVLPVASLASALAVAVAAGSNPPLPATFASFWLVFHVTLAKLSAAAFLLAVATSTLLLVRTRRPAAGLPAAEALDANTVRFVSFGFAFWSAAIVAGGLWASEAWGRYWSWDPLETLSLGTWLAYGSLLHARRFFRLSPRATAWSALGCFALFVATLLVLPAFVRSLHSGFLR
jgi:ABC-type transport system involved in cytochrome c biogenesis permease subunit